VNFGPFFLKVAVHAKNRTPACPGAVSLGRMRDLIEAVGPDAVILSSDFGQVHNPDPVEGFSHYLERLHGAGMGLAALRTMICDNPRRLLLREP
jgi:microsomal dipeptidase-like Zn-dependent dipeptidase